MLFTAFGFLRQIVYNNLYNRNGVVMAGELNKLTDKKLKNLLGTTRAKYEFFADGAGLSIRVSTTGGISWTYTYRITGGGAKLHRVTLGRYPDVTLKQARELRDKCRSWLASGKDPKHQLNLTLTESLKPVTVKEALDYWVIEYATEHRANVERHKAQLNKHIYPYIGHMALSDCETRYWLQCFDRMKKNSPVAAGYVLQMCKQALKYCRVRRYAICDALDWLSIPDVGKRQSKRSRVLSDKELRDVWLATEENNMLPYYRNLVRLLVVFGARTHEVRLSTWNEWDFDSKLWIVPKEHSKTGDKIIRPIPDAIYGWLESLKEQNKKSGYLLGEEKDSSAVSQTGRGIWKRLGHSELWTLHDLRRTLSTGMNDMGIPPHIVELLLGHALPGVMAVYNRSQYLPEKLDALNKWIERLDVLAGNHENVVILKVGER